MQFEIVVKGRVRKLMYDINRSAILKRNLVGLCVDVNWQIWVQDWDSEMVSNYAVREGEVGFANVKILTFSTLELVDQVHRLAVSLGGYGIREVGTEAGVLSRQDDLMEQVLH